MATRFVKKNIKISNDVKSNEKNSRKTLLVPVLLYGTNKEGCLECQISGNEVLSISFDVVYQTQPHTEQ